MIAGLERRPFALERGGAKTRVRDRVPGGEERGRAPGDDARRKGLRRTGALASCGLAKGDGRAREAPRQASASSDPPASASARIWSAMRPAFSRIDNSIRAAASGLALRYALAFSRPCPSRTLS